MMRNGTIKIRRKTAGAAPSGPPNKLTCNQEREVAFFRPADFLL